LLYYFPYQDGINLTCLLGDVMAEIRRLGGLEIEEDIKFQQWEWRVSRLGWVLMALVLLAGTLGVFGVGILSGTTRQSEGGLLEVQYEKFGRHRAPTSLVLSLGPGAVRDGEVRLWIDREYLQGLDIEGITPEPDSVETQGDRLVYVFNAAESQLPVLVNYSLQTNYLGLRQGRVGLDNGPELDFWQLIYP
jgi:hypothetical protein